MLHITVDQWLVMALGAFGIGLSKTGIAGFGIVAIALFANALPAKASVGIVLPVLITGDIFAVALYRRKVVWKHLIPLFPWALAGVALGYFALGRIDDSQVSRLIAVVLFVLTGLQILRRRGLSNDEVSEAGVVQSHTAIAALGILAGFTTMVANAAGPIMIVYLLSARLAKVEFIGTTAWFFFLLNLCKVPFSVGLALISVHTLPIDIALAPLVILGAFVGTAALKRVDQRLFENIAIALTLLAAFKLLL